MTVKNGDELAVEHKQFLRSKILEVLGFMGLPGLDGTVQRIFQPPTHKGYIGIILDETSWPCAYCGNSNSVLVAVSLSYNVKIYCQQR